MTDHERVMREWLASGDPLKVRHAEFVIARGFAESEALEAEAGRLRPPGPVALAANFGRAVVAHAADGFAKVTPEEREARLEVCRGCPLLVAETVRCSHAQCGCWLETKTWWASEACPLGKWPRPGRKD